MIMCYPFYLNSTFQLKHHALALGLLLSGYIWWERYRGSQSTIHIVLAGVSLLLATSTTQFGAPMALLLLLDAIWNSRQRDHQFNVMRIVASLLPLFVLGAFVYAWGGAQPPLYRTSLLEAEVGSLRFRPGQLVAGLLSLGVWIFPVAHRSRQDLVRVGLLWLPSVLLVHLSGVFRPEYSFFNTVVGPVSSVLRGISMSSYLLLVALAGVLVALGASLLLRVGNTSRPDSMFRTYTILYLLMLNFVPYYFESYLTYLIVPGYMALAPTLVEDGTVVRTRIAHLAVALGGIAYTIIKLAQNNA